MYKDFDCDEKIIPIWQVVYNNLPYKLQVFLTKNIERFCIINDYGSFCGKEAYGVCECVDENVIQIFIHLNECRHLCKNDVCYVLAHEVYHLISKLSNQKDSEELADKFAIDMGYYPKDIELVKTLAYDKY